MMSGQIARIGIVGCGNISGIYLQRLQEFQQTEVVAVADLDLARAMARAEQYAVPRACTVEELLADAAVDIVVNLTVPKAHAEVALAALQAGKSVYNEKPLAVERAAGRQLLALAAERGLRVGGAPDTFLGAGHQTCRQLLDGGAIGQPVAAHAFMLSPGHERWHPNPDFFYQAGGGPMFDMGPYYVTDLIQLLGPVKSVTAVTRISYPERTIRSEPKQGQVIQVETPTHITGMMEFAAGAVCTITTSFDVWGSTQVLPHIEIFGTEGTLRVPNPNLFGGEVWLLRAGEKEAVQLPLSRPYQENYRGLGVADMVDAIAAGRPHRASGELVYHVLDTMTAFLDSGAAARRVDLESTCQRPAAMPLEPITGEVTPAA